MKGDVLHDSSSTDRSKAPEAVLLLSCVGGFIYRVCFVIAYSSSSSVRWIGKAMLRYCDISWVFSIILKISVTCDRMFFFCIFVKFERCFFIEM